MKRFTVLVIFLLLSGCAAKRIEAIAEQVPGLPAYPPPAVFAVQSKVAELRQLVSVNRGGTRQSFTAVVEASEDKATVVGFGAFGVRLFLLSWGTDGLQYEANPTFTPLLDPRTIYSDMQFALMSLEREQHVFGNSLKITDSGKNERVVTVGTQRRLVVRFPDSQVEFGRFSMQYPNRSLRVSVRSIPNE